MASADGSANPVKEQEQSGPIQCVSGCGFFGNPSTGNMCSKCFKETCGKAVESAPKVAEAPVAPAPAVAPAPTPAPAVEAPVDIAEPPAAPKTPAEAASSASSSGAAAEPAVASPAAVGAIRPAEAAEQEDEPPKKVQANTSRCWTCNRKIGLLGFQCKCEYFFCSEHRYSDKHECAFDFKAMGKKQLTKANPTIAPAKMESM